jgi:carboxypeptidase C (cathepsin A)
MFRPRSATLLLLTITSPARAQQQAQAQRERPAQTPAQATQQTQPAPRDTTRVPDERLSPTSHSAVIGGAEVRYTATAGTLTVRDSSEKPKAQVFFVAYTKDGVDPAQRPVTFAYNGGPGAATIWLHLGALGPKRVQMADDGFQPAPPFKLVDNPDSPLDLTDLVMIDAISTGYSRPVAGEDPKQFHGVREDLRWMAEFIRRYLTRFNRWSSPKFLFGESYGTARSAGLSGELPRHGIELNGIVLVSSVLNFATIRFNDGNDLPYISYLPTYTATAWYHQKLAPDLQADLRKTLDEARAFALGEYATALMKGYRLSAAERTALAQKVARLIGLSREYVEQSNLRIEAGRFRKELLRDRRLATGRLDGRFTAMDEDAAGERQEFDPSNTAIQGPYTAMFVDYARRELKWESDLEYYTAGPVQPWSYNEWQNRYVDVSAILRQAMAQNRYLKVMVANGYYDMATPFLGTEYTFDHLGWEPTYQQRVRLKYYEAGHMMYIRAPMLRELKRDVAQFIKEASEGPRPATQ